MPKPIVIDFDKGLDSIAVDSIPGPKTWVETLSLVEWTARTDYETVGIDTIDVLEDMATHHICTVAKKESIGDFGYGAGYEALATEWRLLLAALDAVREYGKSVCLLAHSVVRTAQDPTLGAYDQYTPQLQKKTWAQTHRWADMIGFYGEDAAKVGDEKRAIVTGARMLYTTSGTGFVAGNRWSLPGRILMPRGASWAALNNVMPESLRGQILALAGVEHKEKAAQFIAEAGENSSELIEVLKALKEKVSK